MMKYIFLLYFCVLPNFAQDINIPDRRFKEFLVNQYDLNSDEEISETEALEVRGTLDCHNQSIHELTGISYFINVTNLDCHKNKLSVLPNLGALTELTYLDCSDNHLRDVLTLDNLTGLTNLNFSDNRITELAGLPGLTNLTQLDCSGNQLDTLTIVSFPELTELNCNDNQLDLLTINALPELTKLDCSNNQLTTLDLALIGLAELDCSDNWLTTLDLALPELTDLNCARNRLRLLPNDALINVPNLTNLDLSRNQLSSLPELSGLNNLTTLDLSNNGITALPELSGLNNLTTLACSNNSLTALPNLSELNNLTTLNCSSNSLTALPDLSELNNLTTLDCSSNGLTALPNLSGLGNLHQVRVFLNQYTAEDCPDVLRTSAMGIETFEYNPQSDGTELTCDCIPPTIPAEPSNTSHCQGDRLQLAVHPEGTAPFLYQWYKGMTEIHAATHATLLIPTLTESDTGNYSCEVSSYCGTIRETVAEITVASVPIITSQPQHIITVEGATVAFTVAAEGAPLSYQWYKGDEPIIDATAATHTINWVTPSDLGDYSCQLQSGCGTVTSRVANLSFMSLVLASDLTGSPGAPVEVPVLVRELAGSGFTSFDFTLNYDQQMLNFGELITAGTLTSGWSLQFNMDTLGSLRVIGYSAGRLEQDGVLLKLGFMTGNGPFNVDCDSLELQDALFDTTPPNIVNGRFCINDCLKGDADDNGQIQAYDAALVLRKAVNLPTVHDPIDPSCVDADCDGYIVAQDAALIAQRVLGRIDAFCGPALQAPTEVVQLEMKELCLVGGQRFTLDINATRIQPEDGVIGYQFSLNYDENMLSFDDYETEGTLSQNWAGLVNNTEPGRIIMGAYNSQPLDGEGLLIKLSGLAWQTNGQTELNLEQVILGSGTPVAEVQTATASIEWNEPPEQAILSMLCPQNASSSPGTPDVYDNNTCDNHQFTLSDSSPVHVTVEDNAYIYSAGSDLGVETFAYQITDAGGLMIERNASVRILGATFFEALATWPVSPISELIKGINQPESTARND